MHRSGRFMSLYEMEKPISELPEIGAHTDLQVSVNGIFSSLRDPASPRTKSGLPDFATKHGRSRIHSTSAGVAKSRVEQLVETQRRAHA